MTTPDPQLSNPGEALHVVLYRAEADAIDATLSELASLRGEVERLNGEAQSDDACGRVLWDWFDSLGYSFSGEERSNGLTSEDFRTMLDELAASWEERVTTAESALTEARGENERLRGLVEKPEPNPEWEAKADAYHAAAVAEAGVNPFDTLTMLERWKADAEPANSLGQVSFSRTMLDSATDALRMALEVGRNEHLRATTAEAEVERLRMTTGSLMGDVRRLATSEDKWRARAIAAESALAAANRRLEDARKVLGFIEREASRRGASLSVIADTAKDARLHLVQPRL